MNKELIATKFFAHLDNTEIIGYSDFDDVVDGVRVCIDLNDERDIEYLDIIACEVLDDDWNKIRIDSLILEAYILELLQDWKDRTKELTKQAKGIREDEKM